MLVVYFSVASWKTFGNLPNKNKHQVQAPKDSFNEESLSTFVTFQNQTYNAHFTIKRPIINIVIFSVNINFYLNILTP